MLMTNCHKYFRTDLAQILQKPIRARLTAATDRERLVRLKDRRISMVRELQIMTVGLVFLFLGAIVVGVF
jgi:hypothetical protein